MGSYDSYKLDSAETGHALNFLLPKFLSFFRSESVEMRTYAISCILKCIHFFPPPVLSHLDNFVQVRIFFGLCTNF
jgi:hypothetical protein